MNIETLVLETKTKDGFNLYYRQEGKFDERGLPVFRVQFVPRPSTKEEGQ